MVQATWNGQVIADSDATVVVEGNHYFPPDSVKQDFLRPSTHTTVCSWKGTAHYHDIVVGDAVNQQAAWYYAQPKDAAKQITGHIAFWKGVEVQ